MTLSPIVAAKKRAAAHAHLRNCNLCPRLCGVNRYETTGMCLVGEKVSVNVIVRHFGEGEISLSPPPPQIRFSSLSVVGWVCADVGEWGTGTEPCIQGHQGSGAVFFSGCNMRCVFCQNYDISHKRNGMDLAPEELAEWFVKLQDVGAVHNINLVTPEHVVPQMVLGILHAKEMGLRVPVVYNTSGYDSMESLGLLEGLVDVYLPDIKVWKEDTARRLLKAGDYPVAVRESVKEMHRQVGDLCFTGDGIAKRGVLVRHLVMPGLGEEGGEIMSWLPREVSRDCFVNIMEQYRPAAHVGKAGKGSKGDGKRYGEINRAVTAEETGMVRRAAARAGLWRFCDPPKHEGFSL